MSDLKEIQKAAEEPELDEQNAQPLTRVEVEPTEIIDAGYEAFLSRLHVLREEMDEKAWELGDLALEFREMYGKHELARFAKDGGLNVNTLRRYMQVSATFEVRVREEFRILSWTHFRTVVNKEDRWQLLVRAADEGWSVEKLSIMAKPPRELPNGQVIDDGLPVPPQPEMIFCTICRKWKFAEPKTVDLCDNESHTLEVMS